MVRSGRSKTLDKMFIFDRDYDYFTVEISSKKCWNICSQLAQKEEGEGGEAIWSFMEERKVSIVFFLKFAIR